MDKVLISDLEIYAHHGVHREEKTLGQMFVVSAEITAELGSAAASDDIGSSIHYGHVCRDIEKAMTEADFDLIETAAYTIIKRIFENYPLASAVRVCVKKPWAPMGRHLNYVAVEMERTRGEIDG